MEPKISAREITRISTESKGFWHDYSEFDRSLIETVTCVEHEFTLLLEKPIGAKDGSYFLKLLNRGHKLRGSFRLTFIGDQVRGFVYVTNSMLECNPQFVNGLTAYTKHVLNMFSLN